MKIFEKINILIPEPIPNAGFTIPVFSGSIGEPVVNLGQNKINPLLIINNDTITTRAFLFKYTKQIKEIEKIGIYQSAGYQSVIFYYKGSDSNKNNIGIVNPFKEAKIESFNLLNEENLKQLIKFFNSKGVSLTGSAIALI